MGGGNGPAGAGVIPGGTWENPVGGLPRIGPVGAPSMVGPGVGGAATGSPPLRDTVEATTSSPRRHIEYAGLGIDAISPTGPEGIGRGAT
jgi:hypothetical protein